METEYRLNIYDKIQNVETRVCYAKQTRRVYRGVII